MFEKKEQFFCQRRREYNSTKKKNETKFKFNESKRPLNLCKENPKQFWERMKVKSKKNASTCPIKLDEFYKFFMKLSSENLEFKSDFDIKWQEHVDLRLESGSTAVASDELDKIISQIEITGAINELKNGKSPGIDQITAELLKKCLINESFKELLHTLFNKFFNESIFPSSWAEGIIIPIFKKEEHTDPNNYRGITLLSNLGKVFTIILNKHLTKWSESNKIISENQAGLERAIKHLITSLRCKL